MSVCCCVIKCVWLNVWIWAGIVLALASFDICITSNQFVIHGTFGSVFSTVKSTFLYGMTEPSGTAFIRMGMWPPCFWKIQFGGMRFKMIINNYKYKHIFINYKVKYLRETTILITVNYSHLNSFLKVEMVHQQGPLEEL